MPNQPLPAPTLPTPNNSAVPPVPKPVPPGQPVPKAAVSPVEVMSSPVSTQVPPAPPANSQPPINQQSPINKPQQALPVAPPVPAQLLKPPATPALPTTTNSAPSPTGSAPRSAPVKPPTPMNQPPKPPSPPANPQPPINKPPQAPPPVVSRPPQPRPASGQLSGITQPVVPPRPVQPPPPAMPSGQPVPAVVAPKPSSPVPPTPPNKPPVGPMVPPPPGVRPPAGAAAPSMTSTRSPGALPLPPAPPGSQPPSAVVTPPATPTKPAKVQRSIFRFLPFLLIGVLLLGALGFLALRFLRPTAVDEPNAGGNGRTNVPANQKTITYWGLWEPTSVLEEVLQDFETANPGINVEYVQQSHLDYRERLQAEIAQGSGPDVFRFHASWVPMLRNDLAAMPTSVYSPTEFQRTFYPIAADQLQLNGQIVGVPLMYDGLALYYNVDMLKVANAAVPTTWAELKALASQLTVRSGNQIQRGGLAIGNVSNVEHFSDILGLLMLQNGADFLNPTTTEARDALDFYTAFFKTDKVWSESLPSSTVAFARGDAAMMFAPSWRVFEIKALNPSLNFATAPVPKLGSNQITWASYWAEGVNAQGNNKNESWALIKYLSSPEVMRKLHSEQANVRAFGEIHSRVDLASELASQSLVVPFLSDAPQAQSWYLNSYTHDDGINDQIIKYYEDAINAVNQGKRPEEVLPTVAQGTAQVLRQYGIQAAGAQVQNPQ